MCLDHHWEALPEERKESFAQMAVLVQQYMSGAEPGSQEELEGDTVREVARLLARFACNNHTICDEELRPIGVGIYPLAAMVNHSCEPNACQVFRGQRILFKAVRDLAPGDEITISYVDVAQPRAERRRELPL